MPFDSFDLMPVPKAEVLEYNRQLMRLPEWYEDSSLLLYSFYYEGTHGYRIVDHACEMVPSKMLLHDWAVERIWDRIAEENSFHFVRGNVVIRYPHCDLPN